MSHQIPQEEIDKAVAAAVEAIGKSTLFVGPGDKPGTAFAGGAAPAAAPVDTDWSAARKAMEKAAAGEALDDMDKSALKAFAMKKDEDEKKDSAEKAMAKAVSDGIAAHLAKAASAAPAAPVAPAPAVDVAGEVKKALEARDAKQAEVLGEVQKSLELLKAQGKALSDAQDALIKGGKQAPKSAAAAAAAGASAGGLPADLAARVASSDFHPSTIEKNLMADRIVELLKKGDAVVRREDVGNLVIHDIMRPEVAERLKTAFGAA